MANDDGSEKELKQIRILISQQMGDKLEHVLTDLTEKHKCKVIIPQRTRVTPECVLKMESGKIKNLISCLTNIIPVIFSSNEKADIRMLIHQRLVPHITGQAGKTIKNIKTTSGASIKIGVKVAPKSTDRVVRIEGELTSVTAAVKLILKSVKEVENDEVSNEETQYDASNHSHLNAGDYEGYVVVKPAPLPSFLDEEEEKKLKRKQKQLRFSEPEPTVEEKKCVGFHEMDLDERIQKSIAKLGWMKPTLIQERGIPLALEGKDILARGRTGSGKTGVFAVPLIQRILNIKNKNDGGLSQCVRGVVLCPSRELSKQTTKNINELASNCVGIIRVVDVGANDVEAVKPLLRDLPDIIVATPGRLAQHIKEGNVELKKSLEFLVIDEADLIFTFGFQNDVKYILENSPHIYQAILTSATLSEDVETLKHLVLNNPVILKLTEPDLPEATKLTQYVFQIEYQEKYVLMLALFKLQLIRGKTIIFVSSVDRCYKLKIFLEQFGVPCCVLNSELPAASRCHVVSQFNRGVYNVMIAADEKFLEEGNPDNKDKTKSNKKKKVDVNNVKRSKYKDTESGVARGIDFVLVSNVVNFNFPKSYESYIHRVGRTARAEMAGTALSLVSAKEQEFLESVKEGLEKTAGGQALIPYQFKMEELDGFRYRAQDALGACTRAKIRDARLKEIKQELINSEKLKSFFEENPKDREILRHDKNTRAVKIYDHMKNVPDYIIPETLKSVAGMAKRKKPDFKNNKRKAADPLSNRSLGIHFKNKRRRF